MRHGGLRTGRLRIDGERALETSGGFGEPAEIAERQAAIVMGVGVGGLEHRGALEAGRGFGEFAVGCKHVTEIVVRLGNIGLKRHRAFEQFDGVRPAELMGDDAEPVQAAGMVRIGGADLAVQALGLGQPPRLVMIECCGELPGDLLPLVRCHGSLPPTDIATVLAVVPPGIDKVKSRIVSRIAAAGCRINITQNATGGGRP
jgi:hypothetical protein